MNGTRAPRSIARADANGTYTVDGSAPVLTDATDDSQLDGSVGGGGVLTLVESDGTGGGTMSLVFRK